MAIKVAVLAQDTRFLDRLTAVFTKNYSDRVEIYPFTELDVALSSLEFIKPELLLADEDIRVPDSTLPEDCALAYFVSSVSTDRVDGHRAVCKFQRAELICKQIVDIVTDKAESNFIVFSSPAGGVGTSTAAAAFALRLASQGRRVLYLDLDTYGCPSAFFRGEGEYTLGDVLHTLVHKDRNLTELLIHSSRTDAHGVSFFCEAAPECVYPALNTEAISKLLRELRVIAAFEYIVVDLPFCKLLRQKDLWECGATVLVADDTQAAQCKLARGYFALRAEGFASVPYLLTNRCEGFAVRIPELSGLRDAGQIPVLESEKRLASIAALPLFDTLL